VLQALAEKETTLKKIMAHEGREKKRTKMLSHFSCHFILAETD
jgi:hypothetical protein